MKPLPRIEPLQLSLIPEPFDHRDWLFEIKHDGFRSLAYIFQGKCELVSRRRNTYKSFAPLRDEIARTLKVKNAVLDGEIVVLDEQGRSLFNEMLFRRGHPILYVFDLLWLNDRDLRTTPLIERKRILRKLIQSSKCSQLLFAQHIERQGTKLFQAICKTDAEGIVAKRKHGVYQAGERWFKIRNRDYSQMPGRHELFDSFKPLKSSVQLAKKLKRRAG
jgi:bifunctional non-homologous end joining protein LigD